MTRTFQIVILLHILTVFLLSGCNPTLSGDLPDIGVPESEINTRLRLLKGGPGYDVIVNQDLEIIEVEVITSDQIAFYEDYGARLFVFENNQWIEIENYTTDSGKEESYIILPYKEIALFGNGTAAVSPNYPSINKELPLRVILVGRLVRDGEITDEKTAGSIDFRLKP